MNKHTCEDMIKAFGWINNGYLSLYEFLAMMQYIQLTICIFEINDGNQNSFIDKSELVNSLSFFGCELTENETKTLIETLGKKTLFKEPRIHRTEFVSLCGLLACLRTNYQQNILKSKAIFDHKEFSRKLADSIDYIESE